MKQIKINDTDLIIKGIEILNQGLGSENAVRFLTLLNEEKTDYVKISQQLYQQQTIDNIFTRAKKNWDNENTNL
jgi:hypothetical protein